MLAVVTGDGGESVRSLSPSNEPDFVRIFSFRDARAKDGTYGLAASRSVALPPPEEGGRESHRTHRIVSYRPEPNQNFGERGRMVGGFETSAAAAMTQPLPPRAASFVPRLLLVRPLLPKRRAAALLID
uniref:Uncharacterized protein n=1 Tax=Odontella aurita TaxID=265563 RepID=A0A7S4NJC5_9STRA|mmetsp:Transcript_8801/g.26365  ORF Transcript_8801/g.26365 Transcript_8801/m.26365 type:complete len:129 (+) Transcript_8801:479-865(+)